ncbi:MAG: carboxypeptidase regulatory-like domain-containing protein, partial [Planctomycetia bacterium]|nr:carboxypeptidase regulatory-like domain-containing protein [Planctomycetia bacterium]
PSCGGSPYGGSGGVPSVGGMSASASFFPAGGEEAAPEKYAQQKRVEPPVREGEGSFGAQQKRVEPPVREGEGSFGVQQKRVEPLIYYDRVENLPKEPAVNMGFFGWQNVFSSENRNYFSINSDVLLPVLRGDETPEELQFRKEFTQLHYTAKKQYRLGKKLMALILCLFFFSVVCLVGFYLWTVGSYATINSDIIVQRDPLDSERIILSYTPKNSGKVGIVRRDDMRQTQILEKISSESVGQKQRFQWRIRGLQTGDTLEITSREGLGVTRRKVEVPGGKEIARSWGARTLAGQVVSALDGKPLSGVEIRVRGAKVSARTDEKGNFSLRDIPEGTQTLEVAADGYMRENFEWTAEEGSSFDLRVAMNPGLDAGQIRVVLTWEEKPADLDAHLTGPLPDGEQFHISFQDKGNLKSKEFVQLDSDSQNGYGPETITVLGVLPGTYKYFVHDYTNEKSVESTDLARSNAVVKVYYGGQTYTFRPDSQKVGNLWNVCEIRISEDKGAEVVALGDFEGQKIEGLGLYAKRMREDRMEWIADSGGSVDSERAVTAALEWLARHQADKTDAQAEGSWGKFCLKSEDIRCRCHKEGGCVDSISPVTDEGKAFASKREGSELDYVMASTGLAVLAFQAGGHLYDNDRRFSENVRRGLDWMVKNQKENGLLVSPGITARYADSPYHEKFMYEHGIASFALAEACAVTKSLGREVDAKYENAMKNAIHFTLDIQHLDGGWRYKTDKKEASDTSVTGWQILALKSAKEAGIELPEEVIRKIRRLFTRHTRGAITEYQISVRGTEAVTGIGMLVRQFLLDEADSEYVYVAARSLANYASATWGRLAPEELSEYPDFYLWYKCSLAMQQAGGRDWESWNNTVRDAIIRIQKTQGCEMGSWDPFHDEWGDFGGRVYTTALGALTLQVYYRYASAAEQRDGMGSRRVLISEEELERIRQKMDSETEDDFILRSVEESADAEARAEEKSSVPDMLQGAAPGENSLDEVGRELRRKVREMSGKTVSAENQESEKEAEKDLKAEIPQTEMEKLEPKKSEAEEEQKKEVSGSGKDMETKKSEDKETKKAESKEKAEGKKVKKVDSKKAGAQKSQRKKPPRAVGSVK